MMRGKGVAWSFLLSCSKWGYFLNVITKGEQVLGRMVLMKRIPIDG